MRESAAGEGGGEAGSGRDPPPTPTVPQKGAVLLCYGLSPSFSLDADARALWMAALQGQSHLFTPCALADVSLWGCFPSSRVSSRHPLGAQAVLSPPGPEGEWELRGQGGVLPGPSHGRLSPASASPSSSDTSCSSRNSSCSSSSSSWPPHS